MYKKFLSILLTFTMVLYLAAVAGAAKPDQMVTNFDYQHLAYIDCSKDAAKTIEKVPETIKITSNAHSKAAAELFVTFNWNEKQKDDCVLTVGTQPGTLGTFYSFTLLIQSSGTYKMVEITQPGTYNITQYDVNGKIKNINMVYIGNAVKHEFAKLEIEKIWLDSEGDVFEPDIEAAFTNGYALGERLIEVKANTRVVFKERELEGYTLESIAVNGEQVDEVDFAPEANEQYSIVFTNQEIPEEQEQPETGEVLKSAIRIPNRNQTGRWAAYGMGFEWDNNNHLDDCYIIIKNHRDFFAQYSSATVVIKASSHEPITFVLTEETRGELQSDGSMHYPVYSTEPDPSESINWAELTSLIKQTV